jgi:ArsR family transcriptional regulator
MANFLHTHFEELERRSDQLRNMGHPIRLSILFLLKESKEMTVTNIYEALEIEQAVASHHLRILKTNRLVKSRKQGKNTLYSLEEDFPYSILDHLL